MLLFINLAMWWYKKPKLLTSPFNNKGPDGKRLTQWWGYARIQGHPKTKLKLKGVD